MAEVIDGPRLDRARQARPRAGRCRRTCGNASSARSARTWRRCGCTWARRRRRRAGLRRGRRHGRLGGVLPARRLPPGAPGGAAAARARGRAHRAAGARRPGRRGGGAAGWEAEADRFAEAFAAGAAPEPPRRPAPGGRGVLVGAGPSGVVQRHASFEHRWLGDGPPSELFQVSVRPPARRTILASRSPWRLFNRKDPRTSRTPTSWGSWARGDAGAPGSGPDPGDARRGQRPAGLSGQPRAGGQSQRGRAGADPASHPAGGLQPVQEAGDRRRVPGPLPAVAVRAHGSGGTLDAVYETLALDMFTAGLGPGGQDHYMGLLARNACHFAPYTWYRWLTHHMSRGAWRSRRSGRRTPARRRS